MKEIQAPHLNRTVKLGRNRPRAPSPRLHLKNYLRANLPPTPASCDYTGPVKGVLADIMQNDQLGDCVIAGGYHLAGLETGNAGALFHASSAQVLKDYEAIGGYVPGQPETDQGCDEEVALNYWTSHGFANGTKLLGWLAVDATNQDEVQAAMYLFENLVFGIELPDAWISPFPSGDGFVWSKAGTPNPENGHCVVGVGYDSRGVLIDTWGMIGTMTWDAVAEYACNGAAGQLFVMLTPDQLGKGQTKAPNGVSWTDLIGDFDAIGGHVPMPAPVPTPTPPAPPSPPAPVPPVPTPTPETGVTLEEAKNWIRNEFRHSHSVLLASQAADMALRALTKHWHK